ncbi:hypothetical protein [Candidatus Walczuchella monophlebidarum]|nr:hypothetical protein [Candidatus Walczuchella monophlebidarum]
MILGLISMFFGFYKSLFMDEDKVYSVIKTHTERFDIILPIVEKGKGYQVKNINYFVQLARTRPWSALYMSAFYFTSISLGALFFLSIQHAVQAGWPIVVSRVMEGVSSFLPFGGVIILLLLILNCIGVIHMIPWMDSSFSDPNSPNYDEFIHNKLPFLNIYFYLIRSILYVVGWTFFMCCLKFISKKLDYTRSVKEHKTLRYVSVVFILFFSISSMVMGWDWIMSLDPSWFSTLFGWYVLGSYLVSGITVISLVAIFLNSQGYLPFFNHNHLHDLAKYIFATSLLWTYLWFSQFLLYWYGNIPEEVTYFLHRSNQYHFINFIMLIPNFLFPLFGLISSRSKRNKKIIVILGCILLIGHIIDIYNMIMPGSVGGFYGFGMSEIGSLLFVGGGFLLVLLREFGKMNLSPQGNFLFYESVFYEYSL